ncbi:signal transduction histidine kinase [Paraburkholderia bannensis]|uniref:histidine kinase n=1 Tax=Paraburkholderia bannensis TaxID=765414 RepID=A0A7W9WSH9_9BURK|nr:MULTISPECIES: ATP-binding protein [Paraburkholderia]MBB3256759.1 signal transduction histidine kinase [Paraburkholderia sp. WP4_3_2]MBB6101758.1 signal transduction histidine kinase [Paraburkholderia bannensis]
MKLFAKGLLLIAIPSVVELALLGVVFDTQGEAAQAALRADASKQILWQASSLVQPLLREAARVRTAVVLEDPSFIDRRAVWAEFSDRIALLGHMVADNSMQLARVQRINNAARAWRARCAEVADALREGRSGTISVHASPTGLPPEIEAVRRELDAFIVDQTRFDIARSASLRETRERQQNALIFAVVGSMLIWGVTAIAFARNVGQRLAALGANAQRLSEGVALARPLAGDDEIAALDAVLNQTSRRLRDAEQEQAALKLELQARATDLAAANDKLRQESQDNEMFMYSVSHDLRSPLVNLQGFSKELQVSCEDLREQIDTAGLPADEHRRMNEVLDGDVAESLQFLRQAVARSAAIIDALLRMSRAGRLEYRWQRVNVGRIVERALSGLAQGLAQRAQIFVGELPPAWGDPAALEQIFGNLIDNALRHLDPSRPGLVEIGAVVVPENADEVEEAGKETALASVSSIKALENAQESSRDASRMPGTRTRTYYVRDNGIGISAAYLPKLFRAFQRLHGGESDGQGTGLALARRIAERHGGRMWVESTEGAGSTFFVALPDAPPRTASA